MSDSIDIEPYYEARMILVSGETEIRRTIKCPARSSDEAKQIMEASLRVVWPEAAIRISAPVLVKEGV